MDYDHDKIDDVVLALMCLTLHDEGYGAARAWAGESVTLKGFGSFYVRPERSTWVFKFNPAQRLRALFGWSSSYKGS